MMDDLVQDICRILDIEVPTVSYGAEGLRTPTTLAACSADGSSIRIRSHSMTPDTVLAIAHELRHVWQIRNGWDLSGYSTSDVMDVCAYNDQPEEIDAHAFSSVILEKFGVKPLFQSFPGKLRQKIEGRAIFIKTTFELK